MVSHGRMLDNLEVYRQYEQRLRSFEGNSLQ